MHGLLFHSFQNVILLSLQSSMNFSFEYTHALHSAGFTIRPDGVSISYKALRLIVFTVISHANHGQRPKYFQFSSIPSNLSEFLYILF